MPHHDAAMTTTIMALVLVFWLAAHTQQKFFKNVKKVLRLHAIAYGAVSCPLDDLSFRLPVLF